MSRALLIRSKLGHCDCKRNPLLIAYLADAVCWLCRIDYFKKIRSKLAEERAAIKVELEEAQAAWDAAPLGSPQRDTRKRIFESIKMQYEQVESRAVALGLPPGGAQSSVAGAHNWGQSTPPLSLQRRCLVLIFGCGW